METVETIETRRATLQRKDRGELTTIARALGGKPLTRARKDEIIQLIIDLTSEAEGGAGPPSGEDSNADPGIAHSEEPPTGTQGESARQAAPTPPPTSEQFANSAGVGSRPLVSATAQHTDTDAEHDTGRPRRRLQNKSRERVIAQDAFKEIAMRDAADASEPDDRPAEGYAAFHAGDGEDIAALAASYAARTAKTKAGSSNADKGSTGRDTAGGSDSASSGAGSAKAADGDNGDTESGNRRRKRRPRDRDRDRDEPWEGDSVDVAGRLDLRDEGYGFLRVDGCLPNRNDAYVPVKMVRKYGLRRGDQLTGQSRPANRSEKNPALLAVESINDGPAEFVDRPVFESLAPLMASRQVILECPDEPEGLDNTTGRLIDLVAPIGLGQRVLITAPRRCDVIKVLTSIVAAIEASEPDLYVMGLFLDQRPEDITEVAAAVSQGEVAATSFDQPAEEHVQTAEITAERAKRLAESGQDVVLVVHSLTALARAYNMSLSGTGRAYNGNVESGAVHMPKKLFGVGRNLSGAGSVTVIASITAPDAGRDRNRRLVDDVIFDEFEDTANTEIHLDRWAAELDVFPPINVLDSVSRDEDNFVDEDVVASLRELRKGLVETKPGRNATEAPPDTVAALRNALKQLNNSAANYELLR